LGKRAWGRDHEKCIPNFDLPLPNILAALARILRDSTGRFEETSGPYCQAGGGA
jgi:hypothetical protein